MPQYLDVFISPISDNPTAQVLLVALLISIAMDVVLGITGAALRHEIKSHKMREGLMHKISELALVLAADVLDGMLMGGLSLSVTPILVSTCTFLTLMELFSICENAVAMNPDIVDVPIIGAVARLLHDAKDSSSRGNANA